MRSKSSGALYIILGLILILAASAAAIPPTPEAVKMWQQQGILDQKLANLRAFKEAGGCAPYEHPPLETFRAARSLSLNTNAVDTIWVCVILVEFTDNLASSGTVHDATPQDFETLLFTRTGVDSVVNPTGSMTDFYLENTYDQVVIKGDVYGWYMMPSTYAYYVGDDAGLGSGGPLLAGDAIDAAIADGVNFAKYANGDPNVDGVVVVHAGPGAETGAYGIWSHRSSTTTRHVDGVYISAYTLNPEELGGGLSTMGVFSHEWGHIMGLPDLYDLNGASPGNGLGNWSLMAGGSWNGNPSGSSPADMDAWCKMTIGLVHPIWLTENIFQQPIPDVKDSDVVYGLGANPGMANDDFWLVENRQKTGFDSYLPGAGLLIYHIDPSMPPVQSSAYPHYFLSLEQADGRDDLWNNGASDFGDPFPGSTNNRNFHTFTNPNSLKWDGTASEVGVWNISNAGPVMYADLEISYSHPYVVWAIDPDSIRFVDDAPNGNGNGIPEAGETVQAYFIVRNKMGLSYNPTFTLSTNVPGVTFTQNNVPLKSNVLVNLTDSYNETPIVFTLSQDFVAVNAVFNLDIVSGEVYNAYDSTFSTVLQFDQLLGRPQVFLVDDDNGGNSEVRVKMVLDRMRIPYGYQNVALFGLPTTEQLTGYKSLFWFTGVNTGSVSQMTADRVTLMQTWLDAGNDLFLSGLKAAGQLDTLAQSFMNNYLHASYVSGNALGLGYVGDEANPVTSGSKYGISYTAPIDISAMEIIAPSGGGLTALHLNSSDLGDGEDVGVCGVSYAGDYRTFFMTMGMEYINDGIEELSVLPVDSLMSRVLTFFVNGSATGIEDGGNKGQLPDRFTLEQNYPNPFNPTTKISYTISPDESGRPQPTRLIVYNALGQQVRILVDKVQNPGNYTVDWDGRSDAGTTVATGVYLYRLERGESSVTRKMVLLK